MNEPKINLSCTIFAFPKKLEVEVDPFIKLIESLEDHGIYFVDSPEPSVGPGVFHDDDIVFVGAEMDQLYDDSNAGIRFTEAFAKRLNNYGIEFTKPQNFYVSVPVAHVSSKDMESFEFTVHSNTLLPGNVRDFFGGVTDCVIKTYRTIAEEEHISLDEGKPFPYSQEGKWFSCAVNKSVKKLIYMTKLAFDSDEFAELLADKILELQRG
jgi:hypothetical protein